jgi:reactive chlorine resistance protein C
MASQSPRPAAMRRPAFDSTFASLADRSLAGLFALASRIAAPFLRISLGVILFWIGALKVLNPLPVAGMLHMSIFRFLPTLGFVYLLGTLEVIAAVLLGNIAVRYVGLAVLLLFAGTLTIFLTTPAITYDPSGFPHLALAGQFLLKDLALAAVAVAIVANDVARQATQRETISNSAADALRAELADLRRRVEELES